MIMRDRWKTRAHRGARSRGPGEAPTGARSGARCTERFPSRPAPVTASDPLRVGSQPMRPLVGRNLGAGNIRLPASSYFLPIMVRGVGFGPGREPKVCLEEPPIRPASLVRKKRIPPSGSAPSSRIFAWGRIESVRGPIAILLLAALVVPALAVPGGAFREMARPTGDLRPNGGGGTAFPADGRSLSTSSSPAWFGSPPTPGDRMGSSLAYDPSVGELFLSGGWTGASHQADGAWWLNGTSWQPVASGSITPPATGWAAATYDDTLHAFLQFGGTEDPTGLVANRTWSYADGNWTEIPGSQMPAINDSAMAYDPTLGADILYGGSFLLSGRPFCNGTTYEFASGSWNVLFPPGSPANPPGGECHPLMAWDPTLGKMILLAQSGTWELTNTSWQVLGVTGFPSGFNPSALVFDVAADGLLVFGERATGSVETLELENGRWSSLATSGGSAPVLEWAPAAYDPAVRAVVFYGGEQTWSGSNVSDVTWLFNGTSGNWTRLGPPPLSNAAIAFDSTRNETVVFGGASVRTPPGGSPQVIRTNETWIYRYGIWRNATRPGHAAPPPRSDAAIVDDPAEGGVLLFGGLSSNGTALGDTWVYGRSGWEELANLTVSPGPRWGASIAYNSSGGYVLLFGGENATTYLGDTFEFTGGRWIRETAVGGPSARAGAGLTFDAAPLGGLLLFGGTNQSALSPSSAYADTWSYGATGWAERFPAASPPNRTAATLTWDPSLDEVVLFGGVAGAPLGPDLAPVAGFNDTWVYVNNTWTEILPPGSPPPLFGAAATYDPTTGGLLLFGGVNLLDRAPDPDLRWFGSPATLSASISVLPSQTDLGLNQTFQETISGGVAPYFVDWTFGDGTDANGSVLARSYRATGQYNVTIQVADSAGHSVRERTPVTIHPDPVVTSVLATPSPTELGWPTRLVAEISGGTAPIAITWAFGDGGRGTGNPVLHVFPLIASTPVVVWANDSVGMSASYYLTVDVMAHLLVQALASPQVTDIGVPVEFTATAQGGIPPVTYSWNFADGTTGSGEYVAHVFVAPGNYPVELWGNDSAGVLSVARVTIAVVEPPAVVLGISPAKPHVATPLALTANITGGVGPYTVDWNFGDGSQTVGSGKAVYAYSSPGEYRIVATAIDSMGVRGVGVLVVNVTAVPPPGGLNSTPHPVSPKSSSPGYLLPLLGLTGGAIAVAVIAVAYWTRRRKG